MPDRNKLRVGDTIRILHVPEADLAQRERELRDGLEDAGWTANTIERIIEQTPVVVISDIDEFGYAWYDAEIEGESGDSECHWLAILDDDSWEFVEADNLKR